MRLAASQIIERPPAEVFRFVATDHFENHFKWDPAVTSITQVQGMEPSSPGCLATGLVSSPDNRPDQLGTGDLVGCLEGLERLEENCSIHGSRSWARSSRIVLTSSCRSHTIFVKSLRLTTFNPDSTWPTYIVSSTKRASIWLSNLSLASSDSSPLIIQSPRWVSAISFLAASCTSFGAGATVIGAKLTSL